MILMPQIFDVTANENARYKRNELEFVVPLSKLWKNSNFPSFAFHIFLVQNYTIQAKKILGEDPQTPLPNTFTILKHPYQLCVWVERGLQLYKRLCPPYWK